MLARMVTSARLLPLGWWSAYAVFAIAVVTVGLAWDPGVLVSGGISLVGLLVIRLAGRVRPPARHRGKAPGIKHLAE